MTQNEKWQAKYDEVMDFIKTNTQLYLNFLSKYGKSQNLYVYLHPERKSDMCQTSVITNRVERLSKRSYSHRLDVATPNRYHVTQLVRLNRELDSLYEFIYDDWRTITEEDYKMFGGQFVILIQTIKQLYDACKKQPKAMGLGEETKRLGMNYSALYELNSDIVNFCIKMPKNEEMKKALQHLAEVDKRLDETSKA